MLATVLSVTLALYQPNTMQRTVACGRSPQTLRDVIATGTLDGSTSIIEIEELVERSGSVVAWVYLGDNGMHYVQPSDAISAADAALLGVRKPARRTVGSLAPRAAVPTLPDASRRMCAADIAR